MRKDPIWKICAKPCVYAISKKGEYTPKQIEQGTMPIKIGYTSDIFNRLSQMEVSTPDELVVIRIIQTDSIETAKSLELHLHDTFRDFKIKGEWFELNLYGLLNVFDYFSNHNYEYQKTLGIIDGRFLPQFNY